MLNNGLKDRRQVSSEIEHAAVEAEADEELAEVFGGQDLDDHQVRANWYAAGLWPFRRISFECPGCSRWLSVKLSNSGRMGFCPSCDLTVASPDVEQNLPPALVSRAKEIPALPARRIPEPRLQRASEAKAEPRDDVAGGIADPDPEETHRLNPELHPNWNRQRILLGEEEQWGINEDTALVPLRVVTRHQHLAPWLGCLALLIAAWAVGYAFMVSQRVEQPDEIPTVNKVSQISKVPLGSELWVVLDALMTASTPEEMVSLVRKPEEMLPKMQAYYAGVGAGVELPHRFERARPGLKVYQSGDKRFARFEGRCDGRPVKFSFEGTEFGWRLDWESLVGYSDTNWDKFLIERPTGEYEFRLLANVIIDKELDYNREKYLCLHLTDHLETGHGFALLDRYSKQAVQLEKFLKLSDKARGAYPRTWITPVLRTKSGSEQLLELVGLKSASWLTL